MNSTENWRFSTGSVTIGAMFEIGPSLREARKRRGLTSEDVQKAIRIRDRYLNALEEERWELLPGDALRHRVLLDHGPQQPEQRPGLRRQLVQAAPEHREIGRAHV